MGMGEKGGGGKFEGGRARELGSKMGMGREGRMRERKG